jgi:hypothetical protein
LQIVKRVGVLSAGKVAGAMYFCLGLLIVPMFLTMAGVTMLAQHGQDNGAGALGAGMMAGIAIFAPVFYGVAGFLGGMLMAALYNLMVRFIGGIELEFAPAAPKQAPASVPVPQV